MAVSVSALMTSDVLTLRSDQTLLDAMVFLREHPVRHVPVVDGDRLVGVVTDRDMKRATPSSLMTTDRDAWHKTLESTPIGVIMTGSPVSIGPDTPLKAAVGLMVDKKFGCLPVVDGGKLVGIVTATDVMRSMFEALP